MSDAPGPDASTAEIKADIEATREHLADTVDALGTKLDPRNVAVQAKDGAVSRWPQITVLAVTAVAIVVAWRKL